LANAAPAVTSARPAANANVFIVASSLNGWGNPVPLAGAEASPDFGAHCISALCVHKRAEPPCEKAPPMILYPAIDLKDGRAVRLVHGDMAQVTVFNDDPAAQAMEFVEAGCEWLHLVDLNGAFAGEPVNAAPVEEILRRTKVPAQLGGGIRDMATIERWITRGLQRVILGTVAVENPALVREAAREFPGHVAVGIDARNGRVATKGWAEETDVMVTDLAKSFEDAGVAAIIYTDILRDGAMKGPNVEATAALANAVSIPVIASGGVSSLADLIALRDCGAPLNGAISGRALYDGAIDLTAALKALTPR
jgi:phosphoribosylformimino-5-aminoimidazole carboxamide ribotide isomerase